jgi:RNA polymerase sigma factor (TIGR02999 family)
MANEVEGHPGPSEVTRLLRRITKGEAGTSDKLFDHVYGELRRLARAQMAREKPGHLLQSTALVHEAYLRLLSDLDVDWESRAHFYGAAAEAMRRILVEHARKRDALRRGGGRRRVPLDEEEAETSRRLSEILAVDEALSRMQDGDARAAEIVRLRFFAGLSIDETALAMDLSPRTVRREWLYARARLYRDLRTEDR